MIWGKKYSAYWRYIYLICEQEYSLARLALFGTDASNFFSASQVRWREKRAWEDYRPLEPRAWHHSGSTHIGEKGNELSCLLSTSGGATVATDVLFNLL